LKSKAHPMTSPPSMSGGTTASRSEPPRQAGGGVTADVSVVFSAAHRDPQTGALHGHDYQVTATFPGAAASVRGAAGQASRDAARSGTLGTAARALVRRGSGACDRAASRRCHQGRGGAALARPFGDVDAMMLHFHGTPITPMSALYSLAGKCFCVSHVRPDQVARVHEIGQSVMLDNGAFSRFTKGKSTD